MAKVNDEPSDHYSVTTPRSVTEWMDALAEQRGSNRSAIVREAVLHYQTCQRHRLERAS